ncbi:hypothetical protein F5X68DRAFT_264070 [Plectosphaerella plurivora]|uniref:Uncharacterized protein n=1 Tax=Plectosphaerella plurivora TaxID=936078 RepID=A0A9P8V7A1_9PEZI|nr:hypothetical protein F5X68DRAFT_264070 [Plectosphaerella plurivora]
MSPRMYKTAKVCHPPSPLLSSNHHTTATMMKVQVIPVGNLTSLETLASFKLTPLAPHLIVLADMGHISLFTKPEMWSQLQGHYTRLTMKYQHVYLVPGFTQVTDNFVWHDIIASIQRLVALLEGKLSFVPSRSVSIRDMDHPAQSSVTFLIANLFRPIGWPTPEEVALEQIRKEVSGSLSEEIVVPIKTDRDFINKGVRAAECDRRVHATVVLSFLPSTQVDYRPDDNAVKIMTSKDFREEPFWESSQLYYVQFGSQGRGCKSDRFYCNGSLNEVLRPGIQFGRPLRGVLDHDCDGVILEI